ncbi:MAG: Hsp33 family molecular chaperone HslO [Burkholderiaceae bacterium]|nr:Hsp33 family molecular chaperone HslO [Burkholderiaceae bacterium]
MSIAQQCFDGNSSELTKRQSSSTPASAADQLLRVMFEGVSARAHLVRIDQSWLEVAHRHDEAPEVIGLLGEMSCASILLSASLKYQGSVILQIHGDGPVRLAVAECNASLDFRSTIKMSETLTAKPGAGWKELVNQNNLGRFSVVLDPQVSAQSPYQGIVPLHEEGVAQALESYMTRSEQLPTRLWLACNGDRAAGLLLQRMPTEGGISLSDTDVAQGKTSPANSDEAWHALVTLADTLTREELLGTDPQTLLHQLFWEKRPRLLEQKPVQFHCPCSREKVGKMLRTLGHSEVDSILSEQGQVEVNCDFCNTNYAFDAVDCAALFTDAPPSGSMGPQTLQ